jgi:hypothetical protein
MSAEDLNITVIDLGAKRKGQLNESYLTSFGAVVGNALERLLAGMDINNLKVKGSPQEMQAFLSALGAEKRHIEHIVQNGYDDPRTSSHARTALEAVVDFEKLTGLKWPIK